LAPLLVVSRFLIDILLMFIDKSSYTPTSTMGGILGLESGDMVRRINEESRKRT